MDSLSDDPFRRLQQEIRNAISRNHPNPRRIGCPGEQTLQEIAAGELASNDPAYSHIMECSPCYEELMRLFDVEPG